jgi:hypothetical protein
MPTTFVSLFLAGLTLALMQAVAAIPWLWALNKRGFRSWIKDPLAYAYAAGAVIGAALVIAWFMSERRIEAVLSEWGRYYGSILHAQLAVDFLVLAPQLLLLVWPKGGAIALSTFRECWRQPMFWLIAILAAVIIAFSMVIPYYTFGEDYKMMKQIGFDIAMLSAALFGLLSASISINEEIEGRSAITVMSKPVNRRQFLIGKYLGTLLACWAMMLLLGWVLTYALYIKPHFDRLDDVNDTMTGEVVKLLAKPENSRTVSEALVDFAKLVPTTEGGYFAKGIALWTGETLAHHIGLLLGFGQVMVLLAICVALATRMTFVINLVICLFVFMIGHLAPVLVQSTAQLAQESAAMSLVHFIARLLNVVFPALENFLIGPAIIRDSYIPMRDFTIYVGTVFGYAVLYSGIGLILGLILFEDRDLA